MAYSLSLPMTAVLAIAGVGLGVHLGRESIAQINPSFYEGDTPTRFYASLVPSPPSFEVAGIKPPQHPDAIVLDDSGSCASCGIDGQAVYMADGAGYEPAMAEWSEPAPPPVIPAAYRPGETPADPDLARIERYATYPITAEEAAPMAAEELDYAAYD